MAGMARMNGTRQDVGGIRCKSSINGAVCIAHRPDFGDCGLTRLSVGIAPCVQAKTGAGNMKINRGQTHWV